MMISHGHTLSFKNYFASVGGYSIIPESPLNLFAWLSLNKEIVLLLYFAILLQIHKFIADVVVHTKAMSTSVPLSRRQCRPCIEESPHHPDIYFLMFVINFLIVIMTRNKIFRFLEFFVFLSHNFITWQTNVYFSMSQWSQRACAFWR